MLGYLKGTPDNTISTHRRAGAARSQEVIEVTHNGVLTVAKK
jgi:hypothetical protein